MKYQLVPAIEADKERIRTLNARGYRDVVSRQFGEWDDEVQRGYFEKKWHPSKFQKIMAEGALIGVLSIQEHHDHLFISNILIDPDYQGQGYGRSVLRDLIRSSLNTGLSIRLRVLRENRAIGLYELLGFKKTGETETHVLMEFEI